MNDVVTDLAIINSNNENRSSSKLEFVSASSSDIGTTEVQDKLVGSDKKVHWNCKYVQLLLDCVESRMHEFKNKSIHKKVWDDIGKEMQTYGFSTEHCYNKWKNLRRDVRMFAINPNKATKNQETLNRVKKLISTICPNFDPTAVYKKSNTTPKSPNKHHSEESSNSLEPLTKLLTPPTSPFSDILTPINNDENMEVIVSKENDGSSGLLDMKLNLPSDVYFYLMKQQQYHNGSLVFHSQNNNSNNMSSGPNLFLSASATVATEKESLNKKSVQCLQSSRNPADHLNGKPTNNKSSNVINIVDHQNHNHSSHHHRNHQQQQHHQSINNNNSDGDNNYSTSWPYELYDLLVSFRAEELKQAHSIDQLIRQINEIRDSSVRRMNTIQQLMNLANLLISSKVA